MLDYKEVKIRVSDDCSHHLRHSVVSGCGPDFGLFRDQCCTIGVVVAVVYGDYDDYRDAAGAADSGGP